MAEVAVQTDKILDIYDVHVDVMDAAVVVGGVDAVGGGDAASELDGATLIDEVLCMPMCMAESMTDKAKPEPASVKHTYSTNGSRMLVNGMTSDSGAGDTVGLEDAFPEYPLVPSPGSVRGLHDVAANNQRIKHLSQKRVLIMTTEGPVRLVIVHIAAVKKDMGVCFTFHRQWL